MAVVELVVVVRVVAAPVTLERVVAAPVTLEPAAHWVARVLELVRARQVLVLMVPVVLEPALREPAERSALVAVRGSAAAPAIVLCPAWGRSLRRSGGRWAPASNPMAVPAGTKHT